MAGALAAALVAVAVAAAADIGVAAPAGRPACGGSAAKMLARAACVRCGAGRIGSGRVGCGCGFGFGCGFARARACGPTGIRTRGARARTRTRVASLARVAGQPFGRWAAAGQPASRHRHTNAGCSCSRRRHERRDQGSRHGSNAARILLTTYLLTLRAKRGKWPCTDCTRPARPLAATLGSRRNGDREHRGRAAGH